MTSRNPERTGESFTGGLTIDELARRSRGRLSVALLDGWLAELAAAGLITENLPGHWVMTDKGRRRFAGAELLAEVPE